MSPGTVVEPACAAHVLIAQSSLVLAIVVVGLLGTWFHGNLSIEVTSLGFLRFEWL